MLGAPRRIVAHAACTARNHRLTIDNLALGTRQASSTNFYIPARQQATFPWVSHALWFYAQMLRWKQIEFSANHLAAVRSTYRPDLYRAALAGVNSDIPVEDSKVERFFDGQAFDPAEFASVRPEPE